jgi:8-oxo-dGTP pyrophosphatase MutT (NUDIX family)
LNEKSSRINGKIEVDMNYGITLGHALSERPPKLIQPEADARPAAVAIPIWDDGNTLNLLYLIRSKKDGDPWSGHISFPGGRIESYDDGPQAAAERETEEEVGLHLSNKHSVGRLDDLTTQFHKVHVAGFVYLLARKPDLCLNSEIHKAYWITLGDLLDSTRYLTANISGVWGNRQVPAIDLLGDKHPVLWGLTYRFTAQIMECLGYHLPGGSDLQIMGTSRS